MSTSAFSTNCGAQLATPPTSLQQTPGGVPTYLGPSQASAPSGYYDYAVTYYEEERRRGISRTKTGLLLLVIGFFIGWIPLVGGIGSLLEFIGAVMVILGRHGFGREHSRNVLWSIVIFIVGIVAGVVAVFVVIFSTISANLRYFNRTTSPTFVPSVFDPTAFFTGILVGIAITQVSFVLLTYALQKRNGRILLLFGYAASIAASVVNFFLLRGSIILTAIPSLVPALIYGYAYNLARNRVEHGEIPGPPPQSSPAAPGYVPN